MQIWADGVRNDGPTYTLRASNEYGNAEYQFTPHSDIRGDYDAAAQIDATMYALEFAYWNPVWHGDIELIRDADGEVLLYVDGKPVDMDLIERNRREQHRSRNIFGAFYGASK